MRKAIIGILMLAVMASAAMAASTMILPTTGGTMSGADYDVNVSTIADINDVKNCTLTISSTLSGDSDTIVPVNVSASQLGVNITYDTTALEDASDYTITGICQNDTENSTLTAVTGVIVDNTVPTAPTSVSPTSQDGKSNIAFSATVTDAETTACTLLVSSAQHTETYTMTYSGTSCTLTQSLPAAGDYEITVTASDGLNSTASTPVAMKVTDKGGTGGSATSKSSTSNPLDSMSSQQKTMLVVIIGGALWYGYANGYIGKKKGTTRKRRKR